MILHDLLGNLQSPGNVSLAETFPKKVADLAAQRKNAGFGHGLKVVVACEADMPPSGALPFLVSPALLDLLPLQLVGTALPDKLSAIAGNGHVCLHSPNSLTDSFGQIVQKVNNHSCWTIEERQLAVQLDQALLD